MNASVDVRTPADTSLGIIDCDIHPYPNPSYG